jgi:glutathione S-transferase
LLNYLGIPYKTHWLSYPDIAPTFRELGVKPTAVNKDGSNHYSCPSIADPTPNGPVYVSDSVNIAEYLVRTYSSNKPPVFPTGTKAAIHLFLDDLSDLLHKNLGKLVVALVPAWLDPRGAEYFHRTRRIRWGRTADEHYPPGPERDAAWELLKKDLDRLASLYDKNDESDIFFIGSHLTYADMAVVALLLWAKIVPSDRDGPNYKCVWDGIKGLNGGRWERLMKECDAYLQVN